LGGFDYILFLAQVKLSHLLDLILALFHDPFVGLHSSNPTNTLIGFNPLLLELLNRFLQLKADSFIALCQLDYSSQPVFSLYP
jgi:hypothetical protein